MFAQVERGYESAALYVRPHNNRLQLTVNGVLVGVYSSNVDITLDPFLKPGVVNALAFTFDHPDAYGHVALNVKAPGSDQSTRVFTFYSKNKDGLEGRFELPFVGVKKK